MTVSSIPCAKTNAFWLFSINIVGMSSEEKKEPKTTQGRKLNLGIIHDAALSMQRMQSDEAFNERGERTIWHRGRKCTEMLTWENREGEILRQELTMFGMVVEAREGQAVRTGEVPIVDGDTAYGPSASHVVKMDATPILATLEYASHLLKRIRVRDYYAQHLLKRVNDTIQLYSFDGGHTAVSHLDRFSRDVDAGRHSPKPKKPFMQGVRGAVIIAVAGVVLGALAGFLLGKH